MEILRFLITSLLVVWLFSRLYLKGIFFTEKVLNWAAWIYIALYFINYLVLFLSGKELTALKVIVYLAVLAFGLYAFLKRKKNPEAEK